ncbi:SAF domain-containing protein [Archangium gephyra]|uniref:SAF domain-containing protein n=1 Tax=Archangium gephyra TaxID=48 RepID=UPI0035D49062
MSAPRKPLHKGLLAFGIMVGLAVGGVVTTVGAALISDSLIRKARQETQDSWKLVPVVIAKRDFEPDEAVSLDDVAQRDVPEQLATSSMVRPDSATYVVGQRLTVPVRNGEPLRWAFFEGAKMEERKREELQLSTFQELQLSNACERALDLKPDRSKADRTVGRIRERLVAGGSP